MAGTTANGIPYPTGSDRVMDGDNAMQAMAEKIDPSIAATMGNGAMASGTSGFVAVYRRGRIVVMNYDVSSSTGHVAGAVLSVIPAGFRPVIQHFFNGILAAGPGAPGVFSVEINQTNGNFLPNVTALPVGGRIIGSTAWALPPTQA